MKKIRITGILLGLVAMQSGCARNATMTPSAAKPEAVRQSAAKPGVESPPQSLSGKVVETMNAGSYTYLNLEKDGQKSWAAIPYTKVEIGQEVVVRPGTPMGKFTSKSLNRVFDEIVFSAGLVMDTKEPLSSPAPISNANNPLPPGHPPQPQVDSVDSKSHPTSLSAISEPSGNSAAVVSGKVIETMDAGGYTYIRLDSEGKKVWVAVPLMKVSLGQDIKLLSGQEMINFTSKSLNKTFDSVIFSGGAVPAAK